MMLQQKNSVYTWGSGVTLGWTYVSFQHLFQQVVLQKALYLVGAI